MKVAVIDLGTNTCNLLIAEIINSKYKILHQSKALVKLGDGKIKTNEISSVATIRVRDAFQKHQKIINNYRIEKVRCLATSGIRSAVNKNEFLQAIEERVNWKVEVITGEKEADLIFKGALLAVNDFPEPTVILDIGGGSNEMILAHKRKMVWKESQPTGMGRVINRLELSDPLTKKEKEQLQHFFLKSHINAFDMCEKQKVRKLVGCSGAFDTIADIIDEVNPGEKARKVQKISVKEFRQIYEKLIQSTRDERIKMKGMDMVRVDLIVPAVILIELLVSKTGINQIVQTDFALREGVLFEMLTEKY